MQNSISYLDPSRCRRGNISVVGDDHDRATFTVETSKEVQHSLLVLSVQLAGRLIRQDHAGAVGYRAGNRHALALATRQLRRTKRMRSRMPLWSVAR